MFLLQETLLQVSSCKRRTLTYSGLCAGCSEGGGGMNTTPVVRTKRCFVSSWFFLPEVCPSPLISFLFSHLYTRSCLVYNALSTRRVLNKTSAYLKHWQLLVK